MSANKALASRSTPTHDAIRCRAAADMALPFTPPHHAARAHLGIKRSLCIPLICRRPASKHAQFSFNPALDANAIVPPVKPTEETSDGSCGNPGITSGRTPLAASPVLNLPHPPAPLSACHASPTTPHTQCPTRKPRRCCRSRRRAQRRLFPPS